MTSSWSTSRSPRSPPRRRSSRCQLHSRDAWPRSTARQGETITVGKPLISIEVAGAPASIGIGQRPGRLRDERGGAAVAPERAAADGLHSRSDRHRRHAAGIAAGAAPRSRAGHRPQHDRRQRTGRHRDPGRPRAGGRPACRRRRRRPPRRPRSRRGVERRSPGSTASRQNG